MAKAEARRALTRTTIGEHASRAPTDGLSRYFSTVAPMADWIAYPHPISLVVEFPQASLEEELDESIASGTPQPEAELRYRRRKRTALRLQSQFEMQQD